MLEVDHRSWTAAEAACVAPLGHPAQTHACARGTRVATPRGAIPIETLVPGDLVLTRDTGFRPVLWVEEGRLSGPAIRLRPGAVGNSGDLWLAAEQRILIADARAELMFDTSEVLLAAGHLVDGVSVVRDHSVTRGVQLLLEGHQTVFCEGISVETLELGPESLAGLSAQGRAAILHLYPELQGAAPRFSGPARPVLDTLEARLLMSQIRGARRPMAAE